MKIAILGSGLSSMFIALACHNAKMDYRIFSDNRNKPRAMGFQYLHNPCDLQHDLHRQSLLESVIPENIPLELGERLYSYKVYGKFNIPNSINKMLSNYKRSIPIWNINEAIDIIWKFAEKNIDSEIFGNLNDVREFSKLYDLTFSTIPLDTLCPEIKTQQVDCGLSVFDVNSDNHVFYDINPSNKIYRFGCLFNKGFIESSDPTFMQYTLKKVIKIAKVPSIENVIFCGRYGAWDKTILLDGVYALAKEQIKMRQSG